MTSLTLAQGESESLSLEKGTGKLIGKPRWTADPADVVSVVVHGDGTRAVVTPGRFAQGQSTKLTATWRVEVDGVEEERDQSWSVRVVGKRREAEEKPQARKEAASAAKAEEVNT